MFADPAVITVDGAAKSLVRINQDKYSSEYLLRTAVDEWRLIVRNSTYLDKQLKVEFDRHTAQFTHVIFPTATAPAYRRKSYVVMENQRGDSIVGPVAIAQALLSFLTASSGANLTKLTNFES